MELRSSYSKTVTYKRQFFFYIPAMNKQNFKKIKYITIYIRNLNSEYLGIKLTKYVQNLYKENYKLIISKKK